MSDLTLKGNLNLVGNLALNPNGGKLLVGDAGDEALLAAIAPADPPHGTAPPVILPPPPAAPVDAAPTVWVVNSFNKTVKAGAAGKAIVALGMVMQGSVPTWPGMVLPGKNSTVMAGFIPINVKGEQATIFPSGGTAMLNQNSGQV